MTEHVTDEMIEKAARAIYYVQYPDGRFVASEHWNCSYYCIHAMALAQAKAALSAIAPDLIAIGRKRGLEEAAKIADSYSGDDDEAEFYESTQHKTPNHVLRQQALKIAVAIRALSTPSAIEPVDGAG